jgi:anti-sigma B factor antagonist
MSSFIVSHSEKSGYDILELKGELDAHTASHLEDALKTILDKERYNIIVSCNALEYIASAGLGVFMAYIEDVRALGGDIKLTNMNKRVFNVFDLLGFPTLYDILDDVNDAINQFSKS